ncbi:MAG: AAA family ATPase [Candidatus Eremiobacteraeota bacterium]|nr:AAA family ATPase [Candidatus Eremiobacteraeota bacterium]
MALFPPKNPVPTPTPVPMPAVTKPSTLPPEDINRAKQLGTCIRARFAQTLVGQDNLRESLITTLVAGGHILIESVPGLAKTTAAQTLATSVSGSFKRVQCTPDLMPSDLVGTQVFDFATQKFSTQIGPIHANFVLLDEINRSNAKTQSAMLEAMAEKQVSADNISHPLDELFFVIATQNPRDQVGTYPLPVAQLDRFLFKIVMEHIDREAELDVLRSYKERRKPPANDAFPAVTRSQVMAARAAVDEQIHLAPAIQDCLVDIAQALRSSPQVAQGISTRSLVLMMPALQAAALLRDRGYVVGEDIEWLAPHVFGHRIELAPGVENARKVIKECCKPALEKLSRATLRP